MFIIFVNIKINEIKLDVLNQSIYKLQINCINKKMKNNNLKKIDELILMLIIFID